MVFHVLNRGVGRMKLFRKDADYEAFERVLEQTLESAPLRICAYCLMPNHWHFVVWPRGARDMATFMQKLTITHARRWQEHHKVVGEGHVYQSRYKSFPVETDEYFYQVVRYVERNALRAGLVERAEAWRWSSLWRRVSGSREQRAILHDWPLPEPRDWVKLVNRPETQAELDAMRRCVLRSQPLGSQSWVEKTARALGLESTLRPRGRPRRRDREEN
jgi:putative transposase